MAFLSLLLFIDARRRRPRWTKWHPSRKAAFINVITYSWVGWAFMPC